jgi:hypothetical protein
MGYITYITSTLAIKGSVKVFFIDSPYGNTHLLAFPKMALLNF